MQHVRFLIITWLVTDFQFLYEKYPFSLYGNLTRKRNGIRTYTVGNVKINFIISLYLIHFEYVRF